MKHEVANDEPVAARNWIVTAGVWFYFGFGVLAGIALVGIAVYKFSISEFDLGTLIACSGLGLILILTSGWALVSRLTRRRNR
ncbi:MAG: hypothetical protein MI807_03990 [Verrucomicrobiales bacterium]|nr:hypothetical protein [Verrucomicrobiales bacterium]